MSLKAEIEAWAGALEAYDAQDFEAALAKFEEIADSSKILFNIGLIYATLGEHEVAVENFRAANNLDQYLAVAYFQCGVSNFLLGRYEEAVKDFEDAFLYLRGNMTIDYDQLGLKFRLYSCEVLFNKGLAAIYMGREADGLADIAGARQEKQTQEHGVIDEAYQDRGDGYTVFSIPVGVVYRPPANKLKNLKTKNYLGQAKLVAATDVSETFIGFTGAERALRRNASTTAAGPTSKGAGADQAERMAPKAPGLVRRGTAAARLEGTDKAPNVTDLRRRPSDNTAAITPSPSMRQPLPSAAGNRGAPRNENMLKPMPEEDEESRYPQTRVGTQYVDDLLDSYGADGSAPPVNSMPVPQGQPKERVEDWARNNGGPRSRYTSYSSSGGGGGSLSRNSLTGAGGGRGNVAPGRNGTLRRPPQTPRGDNETGYQGSEAGFTDATWAEMVKIRVKLHHASDVRGMSINPDMSLSEFTAKVVKKFQLDGRVLMRYMDEEGSMVSILDEDDWESAVDTARAYAKGQPEGKVEVWVEDQ